MEWTNPELIDLRYVGFDSNKNCEAGGGPEKACNVGGALGYVICHGGGEIAWEICVSGSGDGST